MEYESTIKEAEMNLKNMREKYEMDIHSKNGSFQNMEKRNSELQESDRRLQAEVDRLRSEKDQQTLEYQRTLEHEKESIKSKVRDLEEKYKKI